MTQRSFSFFDGPATFAVRSSTVPGLGGDCVTRRGTGDERSDDTERAAPSSRLLPPMRRPDCSGEPGREEVPPLVLRTGVRFFFRRPRISIERCTNVSTVASGASWRKISSTRMWAQSSQYFGLVLTKLQPLTSHTNVPEGERSISKPHTVCLNAVQIFLAMSFSKGLRRIGKRSSFPFAPRFTTPSTTGDFRASAWA